MNPIKPTFKTEILPILFILVAAVSAFYFYAHFPEQVPMHWNMAGEIDRYGSRMSGAFSIPAVIIGMYLLFLLIPYIDPRRERYQQFRKVYHFFKAYIMFFMLAIYYLIALNALGYKAEVGLWVPIMVGILFIIIGNYLSKVKPNWFVGIRTPWTLSSEEIWNKTHRVGGKLFILGGLLMIVIPFVPNVYKLAIFFFIIPLILVGTIGYSLILYLKEKKNGKSNN